METLHGESETERENNHVWRPELKNEVSKSLGASAGRKGDKKIRNSLTGLALPYSYLAECFW